MCIYLLIVATCTTYGKNIQFRAQHCLGSCTRPFILGCHLGFSNLLQWLLTNSQSSVDELWPLHNEIASYAPEVSSKIAASGPSNIIG